MSVFSDRFKELLALRNMSQYAFAKKVGIAEGTINNWCRGRNEPPYDTLLMICRELGETPNYMLGFED